MDQIPKDLLTAFAGKRVLVAGDVMLDEYVWGEVHRISPEAPVPVVEIRRRTHLPGGAANTAVNVAGLGGQPILAGLIGDDAQGRILREILHQRSVVTPGLLVDPERVTTTKTRIMAQGKHVVRLDEEQPISLSPEQEDRLLAWAAQQMPMAHACILSDYAKGVVSARFARSFLDLARQAGKPTVVDPKDAEVSKFRGATIVKPNVSEARQGCRPAGAALALAEVGRQLVETLQGSALLITCGAEGMSLFRAGLPPLSIPSVARAVFDVTGAGDTVAGALALALAAGATIEQAAYVANRAAGIVVGKVGTASVTLEELMNHSVDEIQGSVRA
jgi:rfaE bifunctional protein kinase chain/domain